MFLVREENTLTREATWTRQPITRMSCFRKGKSMDSTFSSTTEQETDTSSVITKKAFSDRHVVDLVSAYAKENHCQLATFLNDTKLADDCSLLELC